jgi:threonyl-tRNA synthetase
MLVVGNKEKEASTVAVRQHKKGDLGALAIDEFIARVRHEIDSKTVTS